MTGFYSTGMPGGDDKSYSIFYDDFHEYNTSSSEVEPFQGQFGPGPWATSDGEELGGYVYWGAAIRAERVCAWSAAMLESASSGAVSRRNSTIYSANAWAHLTATDIFTVWAGETHAIEWDWYIDLESDDWVSVEVIDASTQYAFLILAEAGEANNIEEWVESGVHLIDESGSSGSYLLRFTVYSGNTPKYKLGVCVDDVSVSTYNVDLVCEVSQVVVPANAEEPAVVEVVVSNTGDSATGAYEIGVSVGADPGEFSESTWPTFAWDLVRRSSGLASGSDETFAFEIELDGSVTKAADKASRNVYVVVNYNRQVPETWFDNNYGSVVATWNVPRPPVLLVPGMFGSALAKRSAIADGIVWGEDIISSMRSLTDQRDRLMLDNDGDSNIFEYDHGVMYEVDPFQGGLIRDAGVAVKAPEFVSGYAYPFTYYLYRESMVSLWSDIISEVGGEVFVPGPGGTGAGDLYYFSYDWRQPLDPNYVYLPDGDRLSAVAKLDSVISSINTRHQDVDNPPVRPDVAIVSHSMGALVVEAYIKYKQSVQEDSGVSGWFALGAPFGGAYDAFASLHSANPGPAAWEPIRSIVAKTTARYTAEISHTMPSVWSLLPTRYYENNVSGPEGGWSGSGMMAYVGTVGYPCETNLLPTSTEIQPYYVVADDLYDTESDYYSSDWRHDALSRDLAEQYQLTYMSGGLHDLQYMVQVCTYNEPTFRAVTKYHMTGWPGHHSGYYGGYHANCYAPYMSAGDGVVPAASAAMNVVSGGVPRDLYYTDAVSHRGMLQHEGVAKLIASYVNDNQSFYMPDGISDYVWTYPPERAHGSWMLTFNVGAAEWTNKAAMQSLPVAIELYRVLDQDRVRALVAMHQIEKSGNPVVTSYGSVEPGYSVMTWGNQITVTCPSDGEAEYMAVVRPSLEMWDGGYSNSGIQQEWDGVDDFRILGHMTITENRGLGEWTFPPASLNTELIEFNGIGEHGFQAYARFTVDGGVVQDSEIDLNIDADGDGSHDIHYTHIDPLPDDNAPMEVWPNPFNGSFTIDNIPSSAREYMVYDVRGRVLARGELGGASARIVLGEGVASGPMLVSVRGETGETMMVKKVLYVK